MIGRCIDCKGTGKIGGKRCKDCKGKIGYLMVASIKRWPDAVQDVSEEVHDPSSGPGGDTSNDDSKKKW